MAWRDQLQAASFRGVAFEVDGHEGSFGRRAVVHEYPQRDKPYVEDLGRKARGIALEAYVIGTGYTASRDALIAALEQPGPGRLIHPYLGALTVTVTDFKLRESTAEGGLARLSITCVEAGEVTFPTSQADTPALVDRAASDATVASVDAFTDSFVVDGSPEFVLSAAASKLGSAVQSIGSVAQSLASAPAQAASFATQLSSAASSLGSLVGGPAAAASSLVGLISGLPGLFSAPLDALQVLRGLFSYGQADLAVPSTTPRRAQQAANQQAVNDLVRRAAVIEAARSSSQIDFSAFDEAVAVRDELAEQLDALALTSSDDVVYERLLALRTAVIRDITARGADLARSASFTPQTTLPALVLAYSLYADATRDQDLVRRNAVRHPGFVAGGTVLEVLVDA
jgi:prophage DNA circulation protein